VHLHIQGKSPDDVADKYNRLLYTVPEYVALSANSPIVAGEVMDYKEIRLLLYEQADSGNAGFPKLKRYPISLSDYGDYLASFPYIASLSLHSMIRERHDDIRIRFEIPFRVENRVYPMQCTMKENMALIEYTVGRLKYAQTWSRQEFPSLKEIEINRIEAIKKSLKGEFIWNGKSVDVKDYLIDGVEKAEKGVKTLGCKPYYMNIIRRRIRKRRTSGDVIRRWYGRGDGQVEERVASLVNRIWEHTRKNVPIV
jgi:gamma-glutamyl:cysteine ligase YbdK (ATP-grasp superfamily)